MGTYVIGDVQGCHQELVELLDKIGFDARTDKLWFTGDLVNRGPDSLAALRLVKSLDPVVVLGNHDLHLLAVASGKSQLRKNDTLAPILAAPDREELLDWLRRRPLFYLNRDPVCALVHAGLPPQWSVAQARGFAVEVEEIIGGRKAREYYTHMYGNKPDNWSESLRGWERLRFITNCLTRLRYCHPDGRICLQESGPPGLQTHPLLPWYQVAGRRSAGETIIFGHWATVRLGKQQDFKSARVHALDTGCVWGGELTAMRLEDERYYSVPSRQRKHTGE
jgi:bis(5'-nucleosyl)-tetraphosphatase (symmetrical)